MTDKYYMFDNPAFKALKLNDKPLLTPEARAAFVNLSAPSVYNKKESWGLTLLFNKSDEKVIAELKTFQSELMELSAEYCRRLWEKTDKKIAFEKFKAHTETAYAAQPMFRDGDMSSYQGYPGSWYIKASTSKDNVKYVGNKPEDFQAGMVVRALVYPMVGAKGFSYNLHAIKLIKDDGVRFGGSAPDHSSLLQGLGEAVDAVKVKEGLEAAFDKVSDNAIGAKPGDMSQFEGIL